MSTRPAVLPGDRPARGSREPGTFADRFALLAECLLTGVYVLIASLGVITLPAALAAGVAHLRRHLAGRSTRIGRFARDWWSAARDLWSLGVAAVVLAVVLAGNLRIAASGLIPGAEAVRWLSPAVAALAAVVLLRVVGAWSAPSDDGTARAPTPPGALTEPPASTGARADAPIPQDARSDTPTSEDTPPESRLPTSARTTSTRLPGLVGRAVRDVVTDPGGGALLLVALGLSGVLVWMLTPLVAVVGGLLCLAVVAVDARRRPKPPSAGHAP